MPKVANIVATVGTFTDKEGNERRRYKTVGALIESKDGKTYLKMDHLVTPDDEGRTVNFFGVYAEDGERDNGLQDDKVPF